MPLRPRTCVEMSAQFVGFPFSSYDAAVSSATNEMRRGTMAALFSAKNCY